MKSKVLAVSAVSAGLTAIALLVGVFFEIADLFALVISSAFVILPLYVNSYKGSLLAYLAGGAIAFLCSFKIFSLVFPGYFAFFGIYPIVKNKLIQKNFNKYLKFAIGLIWFVIIVYGLFFYYTIIMGVQLTDLPNWVMQYILYFLWAIALIVFIIYDRFILVVKAVIDRYLGKIIK